MERLDLPAACRAEGVVRLPGSKSISNRVLLLAALAKGVTDIHEVLDSDDTRVMLAALRQLGVPVNATGLHSLEIQGCAGRLPVREAELFLGNAGTAFRPLTAVLALSGGHFKLSGVSRMHERPIADLVTALNALGCDIRYQENPGFPPLEICPDQIQRAAALPEIAVRGDVSSQFLTALLLALPLLGQAMSLKVQGELISKPYIEITLNLLRRFGIVIERDGWQRFHIAAGSQYQSPGSVSVEGDASSASYFLAAGAIGGGPVRVEGVGRDSIQGDVRFVESLQMMGAQITMGSSWIESRGPEPAQAGRLRAFDADFNHIPDAAMTLAVLALFADGPCTLRNIASWRVKETDRIAAMATELRKLGAAVEEGSDFLRIVPPQDSGLTAHAIIDTYDDHRMAMCFSLVSLAGVPVSINDPQCVAKTFPDYFAEFAKVIR